MRFEQKVQFATLTDIGLRRKNNEDAAAVKLCTEEAEFSRRGHLFVVADGMGGHAVGELASRLAVETVPHTFLKSKDEDVRAALVGAIKTANDTINTRGNQNREFMRMGTTCTALTLTPKGAFVGHVGDSRCYRIRRDRIDQLTFDHSLQWELQRQNQNKGQPEDYSQHRNVITRSLGPEKNIEIDLEGPTPILPGDVFLLCSDGLCGPVTNEEIGAAVTDLSPTQACRLLVHLANLRGGADNCTVVIVRVGDLPSNVSPPESESQGPKGVPLTWWQFLAWWVVALVFAGGIGLLVTGQKVAGLLVTFLSLAGVVPLFGTVWRLSQPAPEQSDNSKTTLSRPHRTAVSKPSAEFYEDLASIESELRKAAQEEGWVVDWTQHRQALQAAQKAKQERRFARGVRDFARAIEILLPEGISARRADKAQV